MFGRGPQFPRYQNIIVTFETKAGKPGEGSCDPLKFARLVRPANTKLSNRTCEIARRDLSLRAVFG